MSCFPSLEEDSHFEDDAQLELVVAPNRLPAKGPYGEMKQLQTKA